MRTISSRGTFFVSGRRKKTKGMLMTVKQAKKLQDGLRERQSRRRTGARETGRKVRTCRRRTRPAPSPGTSSASHARWRSSLRGERASDMVRVGSRGKDAQSQFEEAARHCVTCRTLPGNASALTTHGVPFHVSA